MLNTNVTGLVRNPECENPERPKSRIVMHSASQKFRDFVPFGILNGIPLLTNAPMMNYKILKRVKSLLSCFIASFVMRIFDSMAQHQSNITSFLTSLSPNTPNEDDSIQLTKSLKKKN
jgi:hypothetical protein